MALAVSDGSGVRRVPLTRGLFALVDEADFELVTAAGPWHAKYDKNTAYAGRSLRLGEDPRQPHQRMHTFITGWLLVDHINGDGLDNRRINLRPASPTQNGANRRLHKNNTSGFKGVTWHKGERKWRARITIDRKLISLGGFDVAEAAARAYDAAALEAWGDFAALNFPQPGQRSAREPAQLPVALDASARPRHRPRGTHCRHGHEWTPENTAITGGGRYQACRTCQRVSGQKYRARVRAEAAGRLWVK